MTPIAAEYLARIKKESADPRKAVHVFDMGCGKGKRNSTVARNH